MWLYLLIPLDHRLQHLNVGMQYICRTIRPKAMDRIPQRGKYTETSVIGLY